MNSKDLFKSNDNFQLRTREMDMEQAAGYARDHCKEALREAINAGKMLFRGYSRRSGADFLLADPSKKQRRASVGSNSFVEWSSNSPTWKTYPKRNSSLTLSTSFERAAGFGDVYIVLPEDGAYLGVSPHYDFWWAFREFYTDHMKQESNPPNGFWNILLVMRNIVSDGGLAGGRGDVEQYRDMVQIMKSFHDMFREDETMVRVKVEQYGNAQATNAPAMVLRIIMDDYNGAAFDYFNTVLAPNHNGFHIASGVTGLPSTVQPHGQEVWTEGHAIMMTPEAMEMAFSAEYP